MKWEIVIRSTVIYLMNVLPALYIREHYQNGYSVVVAIGFISIISTGMLMILCLIHAFIKEGE